MDIQFKCHPVEDFINQSLANSCLCEIGKGVLRDAVMNSCGHSYCRGCLQTYIETENSCPACEAPIDEPKMIPSQNLNQIVNFLEIKCKNQKHGCEWKKSILKMEDHLKKCHFHQVDCEFCDESQMRKDMDSHLKKCPMRVTNCLMCLEEMNVEELENHAEICPEKTIQCTGGCSEKVKRKHMDFHTQHVCALVTIDCPYKEYGCEFHGLVDDVVKHTEDKRVAIYHKKMEIQKKRESESMMNKKIESLVESLQNTILKLSPGNSGKENCEKKNNKKGHALFIPNQPINKKEKQSYVFGKKPSKKNEGLLASQKNIEKIKNDPASKSNALIKKPLSAPRHPFIFGNPKTFPVNPQNNLQKPIIPSPFQQPNLCMNTGQFGTPFKTNFSPGYFFSVRSKGNSLSVSGNKKVLQHTRNSSEIGMLEQKIQFNKTYRFKIDKMSNMIGIGIGDYNTLKNNKFCFMHNQPNHGCFMWLFDGNYVINNQVGSYPLKSKICFNQCDQIEMKLVNRFGKNVLIFTKQRSLKTVEFECNFNPFAQMYPIVYLQNKTCQVSVL